MKLNEFNTGFIEEGYLNDFTLHLVNYLKENIESDTIYNTCLSIKELCDKAQYITDGQYRDVILEKYNDADIESVCSNLLHLKKEVPLYNHIDDFRLLIIKSSSLRKNYLYHTNTKFCTVAIGEKLDFVDQSKVLEIKQSKDYITWLWDKDKKSLFRSIEAKGDSFCLELSDGKLLAFGNKYSESRTYSFVIDENNSLQCDYREFVDEINNHNSTLVRELFRRLSSRIRHYINSGEGDYLYTVINNYSSKEITKLLEGIQDYGVMYRTYIYKGWW